MKFEEVRRQIIHDYQKLEKDWKKRKINFYRKEIPNYLPSYEEEDILQVQWEPLVISSDEWKTIEAGVKQRFIAINKYVKDFYLNGCDCVPGEIVKNSNYYNDDLLHIKTNFEVVSNLYGIDIIRDNNGELFVLEDNFARPGGMQYMIEIRNVLQKYIKQVDFEVMDIMKFNQIFFSMFTNSFADTVGVLTRGPGASGGYEFHKLCSDTGMLSLAPEDLYFVKGQLYYRNSKNTLTPIDWILIQINHLLCKWTPIRL